MADLIDSSAQVQQSTEKSRGSSIKDLKLQKKEDEE